MVEIQEDFHPVRRMSSARVNVGCHWTEAFATSATVAGSVVASVSLVQEQTNLRDTLSNVYCQCRQVGV